MAVPRPPSRAASPSPAKARSPSPAPAKARSASPSPAKARSPSPGAPTLRSSALSCLSPEIKSATGSTSSVKSSAWMRTSKDPARRPPRSPSIFSTPCRSPRSSSGRSSSSGSSSSDDWCSRKWVPPAFEFAAGSSSTFTRFCSTPTGTRRSPSGLSSPSKSSSSSDWSSSYAADKLSTYKSNFMSSSLDCSSSNAADMTSPFKSTVIKELQKDCYQKKVEDEKNADEKFKARVNKKKAKEEQKKAKEEQKKARDEKKKAKEQRRMIRLKQRFVPVLYVEASYKIAEDTEAPTKQEVELFVKPSKNLVQSSLNKVKPHKDEMSSSFVARILSDYE